MPPERLLKSPLSRIHLSCVLKKVGVCFVGGGLPGAAPQSKDEQDCSGVVEWRKTPIGGVHGEQLVF